MDPKTKKRLTIAGWTIFAADVVFLIVLGVTQETISSGLVLVGAATAAVGAVIAFFGKNS